LGVDKHHVFAGPDGFEPRIFDESNQGRHVFRIAEWTHVETEIAELHCTLPWLAASRESPGSMTKMVAICSKEPGLGRRLLPGQPIGELVDVGWIAVPLEDSKW
jgi:hypothetical protein